MCPLRVEVNNILAQTINDIGHVDIPHPLNPLAFGGRVTYYGDSIPYASIIGPDGDQIGKLLPNSGDSLSAIVDLSGLTSHTDIQNYTISATRI